jgi:hypothetical protein
MEKLPQGATQALLFATAKGHCCQPLGLGAYTQNPPKGSKSFAALQREQWLRK